MQTRSCGWPTEKEEKFFRSIMLPEEDRRRVTSELYTGGFRWFRSENVLDLERYHLQRRLQSTRPMHTLGY